MKRKLFMLSIALLITVQFGFATFASAPEYISSETAVLMDADTGQVLYNKYMDQPMHPASITKIMTGLLASEYCDLDEEMTVSSSALNISSNSTRIWLQEGERLTVDDGLFSLMIASANDSANVLAEHVAGTQERFAELMTDRSIEIGAVNTKFQNAHGLPDQNHITTAYDMALITREAIKNPNFLKHFNVSNYVVPATNKMDKRYLSNHHALIMQNQDYTLDLIGGKTGYTHSAGNTLVTVAEKDGKTLIAVVLKSSGGIVSDTQQLFNYGFQDFEKYSISTSYLTEPILPFVDTQHIQIGEAEIHLPDEVDVLVPRYSNTNKIRTEVSCPSEVNENGEDPLTLNFYLDNDIPLLELALEYDVKMFEQVEENIEENMEENMEEILTSFTPEKNIEDPQEQGEIKSVTSIVILTSVCLVGSILLLIALAILK